MYTGHLKGDQLFISLRGHQAASSKRQKWYGVGGVTFISRFVTFLLRYYVLAPAKVMDFKSTDFYRQYCGGYPYSFINPVSQDFSGMAEFLTPGRQMFRCQCPDDNCMTHNSTNSPNCPNSANSPNRGSHIMSSTWHNYLSTALFMLIGMKLQILL